MSSVNSTPNQTNNNNVSISKFKDLKASALNLFKRSDKENNSSHDVQDSTSTGPGQGTGPGAGGSLGSGPNNSNSYKHSQTSTPNKQNHDKEDNSSLQLIMEQLAALSQQLADEKMKNSEIVSENKSLLNENKQLTESVTQLNEQNQLFQTKLKNLKESVTFEKVDAVESELKALKFEQALITKERNELKLNNHILQQSITEGMIALRNEMDLRSRLEEEKIQLSQSNNSLVLKQNELNQLISSLQTELTQTKMNYSTNESLLKSSFEDEKNELIDKIKKLDSELNSVKLYSEETKTEMIAVQNKSKAMCDSWKKDYNRIHQTLSKINNDQTLIDNLTKENKILREELDRKAKSLQDAMLAMSVNFSDHEEPSGQTSESASNNDYPQSVAFSYGSMSSEGSVNPGSSIIASSVNHNNNNNLTNSIANNSGTVQSLQQIANKLYLTVSDKDVIITKLNEEISRLKAEAQKNNLISQKSIGVNDSAPQPISNESESASSSEPLASSESHADEDLP